MITINDIYNNIFNTITLNCREIICIGIFILYSFLFSFIMFKFISNICFYYNNQTKTRQYHKLRTMSPLSHYHNINDNDDDDIDNDDNNNE